MQIEIQQEIRPKEAIKILAGTGRSVAEAFGGSEFISKYYRTIFRERTRASFNRQRSSLQRSIKRALLKNRWWRDLTGDLSQSIRIEADIQHRVRKGLGRIEENVSIWIETKIPSSHGERTARLLYEKYSRVPPEKRPRAFRKLASAKNVNDYAEDILYHIPQHWRWTTALGVDRRGYTTNIVDRYETWQGHFAVRQREGWKATREAAMRYVEAMFEGALSEATEDIVNRMVARHKLQGLAPTVESFGAYTKVVDMPIDQAINEEIANSKLYYLADEVIDEEEDFDFDEDILP